MFEEEAIWIKDRIEKIDEIELVLDVGSSTLEFRTVVQPFIEKILFKPLKEKMKRVYHMDLKPGEGVDIVCDVENVRCVRKIKLKFDLIICSNLLEHTTNPKKVLHNIDYLLRQNGHLIITVPLVYPYHSDPIDTMFRPTPSDLLKLLNSNYVVIHEEILKIKKWYLGKRLRYFRSAIRELLRSQTSFIDSVSEIKEKYLKHLLKKFRMTCLHLKKTR